MNEMNEIAKVNEIKEMIYRNEEIIEIKES